MLFSQNARAAMTAACRPLCPSELPLSSVAQDRMGFEDIIKRAEKKGLVPFSRQRLEELIVRYDTGRLSPPGPGSWVLAASDWERGFFTLEFKLPPPVPQQATLVSVNYTEGLVSHFGLKHNFLFDRK